MSGVLLVMAKSGLRRRSEPDHPCRLGIDISDVAKLRISPRTLMREWSLARPWLDRELAYEEKGQWQLSGEFYALS